jgi:3-oxoacyl-[acyl-carrier-protein] synthase II
MRRVVVTGLGLVTPLGTGVKAAWESVINSRCGIISLKDRPGFSDLPVTIGAAVKPGSRDEGGFDASEWIDRGDDRTTALFTRYAIACAKQALEDSGWQPKTEEEQERTVSGNHSIIGSMAILLMFEQGCMHRLRYGKFRGYIFDFCLV